MKIKSIKAFEAYDSRGLPTLECVLTLEDDTSFKAKVPCGLSKGRYEAFELRDEGTRLEGLGLKKSIHLIDTVIAPYLVDRQPDAIQMDMDLINLDATQDKSYLGANTTLAVSMAIYRAHAYIEGLELFEFVSYIIGHETVTIPVPLLNFINGGMHAHNNLPIQEYLVVPAGAKTFAMAMEKCAEFFYLLKKILEKNNKEVCIADEGGYSAAFETLETPLMYFSEIQRILDPEQTFFTFGMDVAASHLYDVKTRLYTFNDDFKTTQQMIDWCVKVAQDYNLYYLEDPLNQDDFTGWAKLNDVLGQTTLICGDDLLATNLERIVRGIETFSVNCVVIKPNQIGTITEAIQAVKVCQEAELGVVISHRSGDTEDDFIADLAVGVSANFIKSGGLSRSERLSKYNRVLEIEQYLIAASQELEEEE